MAALNGSGRPRLVLRCYCCGEPIIGPFALVGFGAQDASDRVMVFRKRCLARADSHSPAQLVVMADTQETH